jgi:hypothetical protein
MLTLRVFLLDLLALVDEGGRRWVLLPNATEGGVRDDGTPIDRHFPMALFETGAVNEGDWPILKQELGLQGDRHGTAWRLNREDFLLPDPPQPGVFEETDAAGGHALPDPQTASDVSWIPRLNAQVNPACIVPGPPVQTNKILARAPLLGGHFRTAAFARVRSPNFAAGEVRPFSFGLAPPQGENGARALADRLLLEYEVNAPSIVVRARSFDLDPQSGQPKTREIELPPLNGSSVVNVLLANVSPLQPQQRADKAGFHFHLYYDLAADPPASAQRPIPFVAPGNAGIRPGLVTLTMPATFENAFRNPIGGFENKICTFARLTA